MRKKIRKKSLLCAAVCLLLFSAFLTGCNYVSSAVVNIENNGDGKLGRKSVLWSGLSKNSFTIKEEESLDIIFALNMEKGSLTLELADSEGNTVYTLSKEGEYKETAVFTAAGSGTYTLTQTGKKFSGSYKISWGDNGEKTEEEAEEETAGKSL